MAGDRALAGATYDRRFADLAAQGLDVHGEAAFVAAFAPRSVLDAGCGTGRVAIELARRGCRVVGADQDPAMLEEARHKAPDLTWVGADLADSKETQALGGPFDVVVMAGNVLLFVAPGTEGAVLTNMARLVAGRRSPRWPAIHWRRMDSGVTMHDRWRTSLAWCSKIGGRVGIGRRSARRATTPSRSTGASTSRR